MTLPRLEIDLDKIHHNAQTLVKLLGNRGITVTGVTKATLGSPAVGDALIRAGVHSLGDSRIDNLESLRRAQIQAPMALIRSPMLSQARRVVANADLSFNTELEVISKLSATASATGRMHGIVLMVELGDLREGIMPDDLEDTVRQTLRLPNLALKGIGTNLACCNGVSPDAKNMAKLSALADSLDSTFGPVISMVSGGNSGNLLWVLSGADTGRINNLRLGESVLLGRETLHGTPIHGLHTDAVTLHAEVIESKIKPSLPWGDITRNAFGEVPHTTDRGDISQAILAIGRQDTDPGGLSSPPGIEVLGASSDHLIVQSLHHSLSIGDEVRLQPNYSALLRGMTSPFVTKVLHPVRNGHIAA